MKLAETYILNQINDSIPQIYVACLASYNSRCLHGQWIDASKPFDEVMKEIKHMLLCSPEENAEGWAIHDYQGFFSIKIDEWEDIETICNLAEKIIEHENSGEAFAWLYSEHESIEEADRIIEENYIGCYESEQDFIYEYVESTCMLEGVPDNIKGYFNYDALLRDLECSGDVFSILQGYRQHHYFYSS